MTIVSKYSGRRGDVHVLTPTKRYFIAKDNEIFNASMISLKLALTWMQE